MSRKKTLSITSFGFSTTHFDSYGEAAEFLGIKSGSRKAIEARCKQYRVGMYEPRFDS